MQADESVACADPELLDLIRIALLWVVLAASAALASSAVLAALAAAALKELSSATVQASRTTS